MLCKEISPIGSYCLKIMISNSSVYYPSLYKDIVPGLSEK